MIMILLDVYNEQHFDRI